MDVQTLEKNSSDGAMACDSVPALRPQLVDLIKKIRSEGLAVRLADAELEVFLQDLESESITAGVVKAGSITSESITSGPVEPQPVESPIRSITPSMLLVDLLDRHYVTFPQRGVADRYIHRTWQTERTRDQLLADLLARAASDDPALIEIHWRERRPDAPGWAQPAHVLSCRSADGEDFEYVLRSLNDMIVAFNAALRDCGDDRLFFPLDGSTGLSYLLMTMSRARRLAEVGLLPIRWDLVMGSSF